MRHVPTALAAASALRIGACGWSVRLVRPAGYAGTAMPLPALHPPASVPQAVATAGPSFRQATLQPHLVSVRYEVD